MLPCKADGLPPPDIMWHKDGHVIVESVRQRILSSGALQIAFAQPGDGGRGPGVPGMSLVPPLSAHPAPSPRRPPARPRLRGIVPPPPWNRVAGGGAGGGRGSRLFRGSLQGRDLPAPLPSSAAGVASRRVARRRRLRAELGLLPICGRSCAGEMTVH